MAIKKVKLEVNIFDAELIMNLVKDKLQSMPNIKSAHDMDKYSELRSLHDLIEGEIEEVAKE